MEEPSLRQLETEDIPNVVKLLDEVFKGWPNKKIKGNSIDFWKWKYHENPLGLNINIVAEADGEIVGCFHAMPQKVKLGERSFLSVTGTDLAVHTDYRKNHIYQKMTKTQESIEKRNNIYFHYGISTNQIIVDDCKRNGYGFLTRQPFIHKHIKDTELHLQNSESLSTTHKIGIKTVKILQKAKPKKIKDSIQINKIDKFTEEVDTLFDAVNKNHNFIIERKCDYLNWRYLSSLTDYIVLSAYDEDFTGYCVLRITGKPSYPVGYIIDLLVLPDRLDAAYALINETMKIFEGRDVNLVNWQITQKHPYEKISRDYGFFNSRLNNWFIYAKHTLSQEINEDWFQSSPPEKIHFVYGDYDWV